VEDERQRQFIYRFLAVAGFNLRQISFDLSPSGKGSAEQWVRENFVRLVKKCRARNARHARPSTALLVMMDADNRSVQERFNELDASLISGNVPKLDGKTDTIARLIPKWSIESWILFLGANGASDPAVNEDESYKDSRRNAEWSELIPKAAEALFDLVSGGSGGTRFLLDSLRRSLDEIPRALPVGR
jgi:hypothetical protein